MNWYFDVLKKYAVFEGRARRTEYWMYTLFNFLAYLALAVVGAILDMHRYDGSTAAILITLYSLAVLIPGLAVTVRRLHDTGRSGWWILICLVPFVGGIILFVFTVLDSVPDNEYGPNPKAIPA